MRRLMDGAKNMSKEWAIYGEEHVLEEDTMEWVISLPDVTEVLFVFLPFGTTKNDSGGRLIARLRDDEKHFDIDLQNTVSNNAAKIWNMHGAHTLLDNGIVFADVERNGSYWDFIPFTGSNANLNVFAPCETSMRKVDTIIITGEPFEKYIGAGSKIKIWAR